MKTARLFITRAMEGGRCVIFFFADTRKRKTEKSHSIDLAISPSFAIVFFFSGGRLIFFSDNFDAESFELRHTTRLSLTLSPTYT